MTLHFKMATRREIGARGKEWEDARRDENEKEGEMNQGFFYLNNISVLMHTQKGWEHHRSCISQIVRYFGAFSSRWRTCEVLQV